MSKKKFEFGETSDTSNNDINKIASQNEKFSIFFLPIID